MDEDRASAATAARSRLAFAAVLAIVGAFLTVAYADTYAERANGRDALCMQVAVVALMTAAIGWGAWGAVEEQHARDSATAHWSTASGLAVGAAAAAATATALTRDVWTFAVLAGVLQAVASGLFALASYYVPPADGPTPFGSAPDPNPTQ